METITDDSAYRKLFDQFMNDEASLPLRKNRSQLETQFGDNLQLIRTIWSGEEALTLQSLSSAKAGLLRAYQINNVIEFHCSRLEGHDEVINKIQSALCEKLEMGTAYINAVNRWIEKIDRVEPDIPTMPDA
ncbi:hypothetical protein MN546_07340 [Pseudomonas lundensis]|uniref:hypothetical protein n=1 Tax=Pseudomonas lundensis TaxID=86185 RepID=UPI0021C0E17A|nr:hypothetical protein [Pseudomonas lundensis]MCT8952270.1 hypothetical protein [Pseudomonas lundensis]